MKNPRPPLSTFVVLLLGGVVFIALTCIPALWYRAYRAEERLEVAELMRGHHRAQLKYVLNHQDEHHSWFEKFGDIYLIPPEPE